MSLDVYLETEPSDHACECSGCGNKHTTRRADTLYSANITHNLNTMADAAGIYRELWRPDEIAVTTASQLIEPLAAGLARLEAGRHGFEQHNPDNGWGDYNGLVRFVREYLDACREHPTARVRVWR